MKSKILIAAAMAISLLMTGCFGNGNDHSSSHIPSINGSTYTGGIFFLVGEDGGVITSSDGVSWTLQGSGTSSTLYTASTGDSVYAYGAGGTSIFSFDGGVNWNNLPGHDSSDVYGSTYLGFPLTVGKNGHIQRYIAPVNNQAPGTPGVWTSWDSNTTENLRGVAEIAKGFCIAVGDNGTMRTASVSDSSWTSVVSGTNENLNAVTLSQNTIVVGDHGTILLSSGEEFSSVTSNTTANLRSVAVGFPNLKQNQSNAPINLSILVAVGDGGTILTSVDGGNTWATRSSTTTEDLLTVVGTQSNGFVAAGKNGIVLSSLDGVAWTQRLPIQN